MKTIQLANTDLTVSRLCLGCMTYGEPDRGKHAWTLPEESSRPLIKQALEAGINFFDTANSYSDGSSEEIVGASRSEQLADLVKATEVELTQEEIIELESVYQPHPVVGFE